MLPGKNKQTNKQTFLVFLVFQALILCRSNQLQSTAQIQDGKKLRRISDAEHYIIVDYMRSTLDLPVKINLFHIYHRSFCKHKLMHKLVHPFCGKGKFFCFMHCWQGCRNTFTLWSLSQVGCELITESPENSSRMIRDF